MEICARVCTYTQPQTCLRVHLSVCNGVYSEERLGGTERREGGRAVEGFRGKKCGHQLLAADPGRRLLDGNPAADV